MKSKFKSLFKSLVFWAVFFCLLISLIFYGELALIFNDLSLDENYGHLFNMLLYGAWHLFIAIYVVFTFLIFINRFPERLKRFEKFKYLLVLFLVLLVEMTIMVSALPDLD